MAAKTSKALFLAACAGQPVERVPVWIMRQAGRYLPGYRALREKHSFLQLCKTPELAAQVSLEPLETLGVDAAIVFSDILVVAEAMGMDLEVGDAGPILLGTIRGRETVDALREFDPAEETRFVLDAISGLARAAGADVPVIGFAAAPWTLACYMIEGQASGTLARAKRMMYSDGGLLRLLLEKIARVTARYLRAQIAAGAAAIQLFDTWAGELARADYDAFALPATRLLVEELAPGSTPVILYAKGSAHLVESMARAGASVLSVDWRADLAEARARLGPAIPLQGNVDPCVLLGPEEGVVAAARAAVGKTGGRGHVLNLGHGILPQTPVEHARAFVRAGQQAPVQSSAP
jgi:uroporphyrinogen decarboxylase